MTDFPKSHSVSDPLDDKVRTSASSVDVATGDLVTHRNRGANIGETVAWLAGHATALYRIVQADEDAGMAEDVRVRQMHGVAEAFRAASMFLAFARDFDKAIALMGQLRADLLAKTGPPGSPKSNGKPTFGGLGIVEA